MTGPLWILVIPTIWPVFYPLNLAVNHVAGLHHTGGTPKRLLQWLSAYWPCSSAEASPGRFMPRLILIPIADRLHGLSTALKNRLYFDEIFNGLIYVTHEAISKLAQWLDRMILGGFVVKGLSNVVDVVGRGLRLFQTGSINTYAFLFVCRHRFGDVFCNGRNSVTLMSILTFILILPLLGAGLVAMLPKSAKGGIRAVALASTALSMLCAIGAFLSFNGAAAGPGGYKFYQKVAWVTSLDINYQVGADGINIGLILMGAIVSFAAVCVSEAFRNARKNFIF
jgi:NADH:ubiquinone oxidoreductase subunit 5 (subunit L)/multisubunit Na+/H+ antiporter MnhA subunit